jgi:hypothetical protein
MVTLSAKATDPREPIFQIEPFALAPHATNEPTAFALSFVAGGTRYEYRVAATVRQVVHESLRAFPGKREQLWFQRNWDASTQSYVWTPDSPTGFKRDVQLESYTLPNMLFLSKAVASNRTDLEPVFRWFKDNLKFLDLSARSQMGVAFSLQQIAEQTAFAPQIVDLLRHADLGITNASAVEQLPSEAEMNRIAASLPPEKRADLWKQTWLKPQLSHRAGQAQIPLPWESESAGTHRLFALAGPWLDILANGYVVCVDELETSMHPLMVQSLLRLIFCAKDNPKGAQLLFTTHNPLLLDSTLMRRDQIWLTEKDPQGESHLYPLTDYSPRKGESLVRGYLSGRYGGVPFLSGGLIHSDDKGLVSSTKLAMHHD